MARLISVGLGRGVEVVINLIEAERRFGDRAREVVERMVEHLVREAFVLLGVKPRIEEGLAFIKVVGLGASGQHLGFIERAAEEVEMRVTSRLAAQHYLTAFLSKAQLEEFPVAVYEHGRPPSASVAYAVAWELARALARLLRREAAPYGAGRVAVALVEGVQPPDSFEVAVGGFEGALRLMEIKRLNLSDPRDARYVRLLLNEVARRRLAERGMVVDRQRAYWDYSVVEGPAAVRRGLAFTSTLAGRVPAYMVSPTLSVEARSTLGPGEARPGVRVRRLSDGISGVILEDLGGGRVRARLGGAEAVEEASNLVRIYTMRELEELGLAASVLLSLIHI